MKKLIIIAILFLVCNIVSAQGYDYSIVTPTGQTLYFILEHGTMEVVAPSFRTYGVPYRYFSRPTGALTIPDSVVFNGIVYPVTGIQRYAFDSCSGLTTVTIPNTITSIRQNAFRACSGITSITIPNSVKLLIPGSFDYCAGLTVVNFNTDSCDCCGGYGYYSPFRGCTNLSTINFGNNVTTIPK